MEDEVFSLTIVKLREEYAPSDVYELAVPVTELAATGEG
ncbi:hypothetical protein AK972_4820 [Pseudomonas yamanorum]|nr:hypothetical protein AK972_4820 [Pseudomonas yamanorum]